MVVAAAAAVVVVVVVGAVVVVAAAVAIAVVVNAEGAASVSDSENEDTVRSLICDYRADNPIRLRRFATAACRVIYCH